MKNFIFISPNFPTNYWQFCRELKNNGINVLGIGDQPYQELMPQLLESLTEYYKVNSLEHYDEVYRAVAFFTFKYGRIDFIESNNEYWLETDAGLRTDFNISTGFQVQDLPRIKCKSKMKEYYRKAGIPVARWTMAESIGRCLDFIREVRYPVIVKPDNGVGASHTYRLNNDCELMDFFASREPGVSYIMEELIHGEINSYDAIIDAEGNPVFETGNCTPISIMDSVNDGDDAIFYIVKELADDTRKAGRDTVKSFGVRSRFVHFEFFRLLSDHEGIGKKGTLMALEVNMRPCGGFTPDMINFARDTNVYKIWADMIAFNKSEKGIGGYHFCGFAGLRDAKDYVLSHEGILERYGSHIRMSGRLPDALAAAMGNRFYIAVFDSKPELDAFFSDLLATRNHPGTV